MQQNSFQKNGLLNVNSSINNSVNNEQLGRKSIQDIRDDMYEAKTRGKVNNLQNTSNNQLENANHQSSPNYRQRIENMKNFNRWK